MPKKDAFNFDALLEAPDPITPLPIGKRFQPKPIRPFGNLDYLAGAIGSARTVPGPSSVGQTISFPCPACGGNAEAASGFTSDGPFTLRCSGTHPTSFLRTALTQLAPLAFEARDDVLYSIPSERAEAVIRYSTEGLGVLGDRDAAAALRKLRGTGDATSYVYTAPNGEPLIIVCRRDYEDGAKKLLPIRLLVDATDGQHLESEWPKGLLPPYNWADIDQRPDAAVLIVEGEQTAEAAKAMFPDLVVTTSAWGAANAAKTDWSPLIGRNVVIWRDNDDAGAHYGRAAAALWIGVQKGPP